jgi:hypothetical protein
LFHFPCLSELLNLSFQTYQCLHCGFPFWLILTTKMTAFMSGNKATEINGSQDTHCCTYCKYLAIWQRPLFWGWCGWFSDKGMYYLPNMFFKHDFS